MTRKNRLLILLGILIALIILIIVESGITHRQPGMSAADEAPLAAQAESAVSLSWTRDGSTVDLAKDGETWVNQDDASYPIDQETVKDLLTYLKEMHASFAIKEADSLGQYGLSEPECTMTIESGNGTEEVKIGGMSSMDSKRYLSLSNGTVYLIDDDPLEHISGDVSDYLERDDLPEYEFLTEMKITGNASLDVIRDTKADYAYTDAYEYYAVSGNDHQPLDTDSVMQFANTLTGLDLGDQVSYNAASDLAQYGLDAPLLTVYMNGVLSQEEEGAGQSQEVTLCFSVTGEGDSREVYLHPEGSDLIYRVGLPEAGETAQTGSDDEEEQQTFSGPLLADEIQKAGYDSLRPAALAVPNWSDVTGIDLQTGSEKCEAVINHGSDGDTLTVNGKELPKPSEEDGAADRLAALESALEALRISEFTQDKAAGTEELSVTIHLNKENAPERKLEFYQLDGDSCVAVVDGETVGRVPRTQMAALKEMAISLSLS